MLHVKKLVFFTICAFSASIQGYGQVAKSPFSFRGIGDFYGNSLAHNQGMAGVGVSNPQYYYLNNQNPALLVFNRFTVFQAGVIGERRTARGNGLSETNGDGNLNYLVTAFPVLYGKWSTSIGLMPYSSVNYRLNYTEAITGSTNTAFITESGTGGLNQLQWSNGVSLTKNFSIGLKAAYLFGPIINEYTNTLTQGDQPIQYFPNIYERNYAKGFNLSAGFSFHLDSIGGGKKNYKLNIGGVYEFKSNLNTEYYARIERKNASGLVDSTTLINNVPGELTVPSSFTSGISFGKGEAWMIGADITFLDYSKYSDYKDANPTWGTKGIKLGVGTEFTPDPTALGSYLKRITYRTGVSYDKYPYLINGNLVKDFGINFGFSLPVSRSSLDFALKVGKRGDQQKNTIEENYFKVYFGVTFNDQWFIKRRFD